MRERIEAVLAEIRTLLQKDGGDIRLVEITGEGIVKVHISGSCPTCPNSMLPLIAGIGRMIMEQVPEVREVVSV